MKKILAQLAVFGVVFTGALWAAITSSGGSETWSGVYNGGAVPDGTKLTDATLPQGGNGGSQNDDWSLRSSETGGIIASGTAVDATSGFFIETTQGGGTDPTAAFTTAVGAAGKPSSTDVIRLSRTSGYPADQTGRISMMSPYVTGRDIHLTFWAAAGAAPIGTNDLGIYIALKPVSDPAPSTGSITWSFQTTNRDLFARTGPAYSTTAGNVDVEVGAGTGDNSDYAVNEWNKFEIITHTPASGSGTASFKLNGGTTTTLGLSAETGTKYTQWACWIVFYSINTTSATTNGSFFIDDISLDVIPSSVEDWKRIQGRAPQSGLEHVITQLGVKLPTVN